MIIGLASAGPLSACPMCKLANETSSRLPTAYMYSILFMMSMPATLVTGFGIGFYRLSRRAAEEAQAAAAWDTDVPAELPAAPEQNA